MSNKIIFVPANKKTELVVTPPKPAKLTVPEWFKHIPAINEKNIKVTEEGTPNVNVKNCIPFLDIMTSGYVQETWVDIHIDVDSEGYVVYNQSSVSVPQVMSHREKVDLPIENNFYNFEFLWSQLWIPKVEDGYSCIYINPPNRPELPFYTTAGFVDADKMNYSSGGNVPFYIKKGFTGIIPAGTPMYHIIPIKRESWKMSVEKYNNDKAYMGATNLRKNFVGSYKKRLWAKKDFS